MTVARTLELALNRVFRSRWGVAVVLALLVLAVVGIGRLFNGGTDEPPLTAGSPAPAISANPSDDDTVITAEPPPSPARFPGAAEPEAVAYAFASAWVDHHVSKKEWHDGILPNATQRLAEQLDNVDPASVPADRLVGRPTLVPAGDGLVNAVVTTDSGKLTLKLVAPDKHWLVDGIDWDPA
jgi:hypothetical protein